MPETYNPCYIIEEKKLRENLTLLRQVSQTADIKIILALKAFANWRIFPIIREYVSHTTASSLFEAHLSVEEFGTKTYTYSPAYEDDTFEELMLYSDHITFNSLSQYHHFKALVEEWNRKSHNPISMGLRINPEYSEITTELYNPCAPGSRFGIPSSQLQAIPEGIEGLHFHCLCENDSISLAHTLEHVEKRFGHLLSKIKWLNMGGGHLITRKGYNIQLLIDTLHALKQKHPNLELMIEPGSAFLWQTGYLVSRVIDIVENHHIKTAILNVSFTCHMPDCLEMPYHPEVRGAKVIEDASHTDISSKNIYRLGGNSCLSGDYMGYWMFEKPLKIGDEIIFEDMIHYTTVKTNMFNGINHPSLAIKYLDNSTELLRNYTYEDYKLRMD